ncbi:hypothetical protein H4219_003742 [Mycoemilia scoparia]|uniref:Uncharacterized protein n=1 Tax=Mycoemilia scoparia TaxID=417184 RepID=A0A9W7ZU79_9FUNG|nr:hypothetical protein H4219_003742 [Mycoemilia scoparia]
MKCRSAKVWVLYLVALANVNIDADAAPNNSSGDAQEVPAATTPAAKPWDFVHPAGYDYCEAPFPVPSEYKPVPKADLKFVQMIFRHGDRTAITMMPKEEHEWNVCNHNLDTNIYSEANEHHHLPRNYGVSLQQRINMPSGPRSFAHAMYKGNCVPGQLTDKGKEMQVRLGKSIRSIYVDNLKFLAPNYQTGSIHLRSTHVWRTKNSAQSLISGLYPAGHWPPNTYLPLNTNPEYIETMYPNLPVCPPIRKLIGKLYNETVWRKFTKSQQPFEKRLRQFTGTEESHLYPEIKSWHHWLDIMQTRKCHKKALPCKANPKTGKRDLAEKDGGMLCATPEDAEKAVINSSYNIFHMKRDGEHAEAYLRLAAGSFFNDLMTELESVVSSLTTSPGNSTAPAGQHCRLRSRGHKFSMYSAHDDTVSSVLGMLKADDKNMAWPPYSSNMLIELWRKQSGDFVVRAIYNGQVLTLKPGNQWCDLNGCDVNKYLKHINKFVPEDLEKECGAL